MGYVRLCQGYVRLCQGYVKVMSGYVRVTYDTNTYPCWLLYCMHVGHVLWYKYSRMDLFTILVPHLPQACNIISSFYFFIYYRELKKNFFKFPIINKEIVTLFDAHLPFAFQPTAPLALGISICVWRGQGLLTPL